MITNGGFETAGALPGDAAEWTRTFVSTAEEYADVDGNSGAVSAHETFDAGWPDGLTFIQFSDIATDPDVERAEWETSPGLQFVERFEPGWPTLFAPQFLPALSAVDPAVFSTDTVDDFESGWGDVVFAVTFSAADFGTGAELFETGWGGIVEAELGLVGDAAFGVPTGTEITETFEHFIAPFATTVDPTANTVRHNFVGFVTGNVVRFSNTEGDLPSPLQAGVDYYAVVPGGATTTLSAQLIGSVLIDLTDAGTGTTFISRDPAKYWTEELVF